MDLICIKKAYIVIGMIVLFLVGYGIGAKFGTDQAAIEFAMYQKLNVDDEYQKTAKELNQANKNLEATNQKIEEAKKELESKKSIVEAVLNFASKQKKLEEEFATNSKKLEELKTNVATTDAQLKEKLATLQKLTGDIPQATGNPVTLLAGFFTVGDDIEAGRYRVTGSSFFGVYDKNGHYIFSTLLGDTEYSSGDYVCYLKEGNRIENGAITFFTPIE